MMERPPPPPPLRRVGASADAELFEFGQNILIYVMNTMCCLIIEADKAARSLGEDAIKEMITDAVTATRGVLSEVARHLPEDEDAQREYAQRFLDTSLETGESEPTSGTRQLLFDTEHMRDDSNGDEGVVQERVSPQQMRRVGDEFGALDLHLAAQDIVGGLQWVKMVIADVQTVLLDFDDGDLEELSQMVLISLRILVGYARSTHRNLVSLCAATTSRPRRARTAEELGADDDRPAETEYYNSFRQIAFEGDIDDANMRQGGLPWEPLAPRLVRETQRLAAEGKDRPFTATVVLAAALPFSGAAFFFGAPILAGDAALQWGANTRIGRTVGQSTTNAVELGKLGWVASKLATKQTLRLASKELERVGGVTGLVWLAGEGVLWTAWHPIEATMTGVGLVADAGRSLYDRALWVGDLLATVREETFAGPVVDA